MIMSARPARRIPSAQPEGCANPEHARYVRLILNVPGERYAYPEHVQPARMIPSVPTDCAITVRARAGVAFPGEISVAADKHACPTCA
jgi:hypothetical protein